MKSAVTEALMALTSRVTAVEQTYENLMLTDSEDDENGAAAAEQGDGAAEQGGGSTKGVKGVKRGGEAKSNRNSSRPRLGRSG